ncbi:TPA: hypothetical protein DCX16_01140 [bacterium]|nr:hypothetical protein [bacterium]
MKLLTLYLLSILIKPFFIALILLQGILIIGHYFNSLEMFLTYKPDLFLIIKYIMARVPENLILTIPTAGVIAVLSTSTRLVSKRELTCLFSSGIKSISVVIPVFSFFLFFSITSFFVMEFLVPRAKLSYYLLKKRIKKEQFYEKKAINLKIGDFFIAISEIDGNIIKDIRIQSEGLLILGKIGEYKNGMWYLKGGIEREIKDGEVKIEKEISNIPFFLSPNELLLLSLPLDNTTRLSKILSCILLTNKLRMENNEYVREFHKRIAICFSSIVLSILGLGIIMSNLKFASYGSIGIGLLISFLYWQGFFFFSSLNASSLLSPWAMNIIYMSIGIRLLSVR